MTDLELLATELRQRTEWQDTPEEMTDVDFLEIVRQAIRHMYVMTGRQTQYGAEDTPVLTADEFEYV